MTLQTFIHLPISLRNTCKMAGKFQSSSPEGNGALAKATAGEISW